MVGHKNLTTCKIPNRRQKIKTAITKRGQTVIPAPIRNRYQIQPGDDLVWLDDGQTIKVIPVPSDP